MKDYRDWMARALLFEADVEHMREAGVKIGSGREASELTMFQQALSPFNFSLRLRAVRMARLYSQLYCFENSVRELIRERLEANSVEWWDKLVPKKVQTAVEDRRSSAKKNTWLELDHTDRLQFSELGHLADIVISQWPLFEDLIPSQTWFKQKFDEIEKVRNSIAHNRLLSDSEFQRIEMYIMDWNKQVGF